MKVTYIHQYFTTPELGGGTRPYELAKRLTLEGHKVSMVHGNSEIDSIPFDNFSQFALDTSYSNNMSFFRRILAFFEFAFKAWRSGRKIPTDIVFASSTPLTVAIPGVLIARHKEVPFVLEVRDVWPKIPIALGALKNPLSRYLAQRLERWAYKNADAIIALSPGMARDIRAIAPKDVPVTVIPNGCDVDVFSVSKEDLSDFKASDPWFDDSPLILYAGAFGIVNQPQFLIQIAHQFQKRASSVKFLLVGSGRNFEMCRELASSYGLLDQTVRVEKQVSKNTLALMFACATICTTLEIDIPEIRDASSNKTFDALAAGKPVATNNSGWLSDVIQKNQAGILLSADLDAAYKQLAELVGNDNQLAAMELASAQLARKNFDRENQAQLLISILENLSSAES